MRLNIVYVVIFLLAIIVFNINCGKYLEEKSDKKYVVITSLNDLQSLLDFDSRINKSDPGSPEAVADNYYITDADFLTRSDDERNMYLWSDSNIYRSNVSINDWGRCYNNVYIANTVLFNIEKMSIDFFKKDEFDNVKGQAYYLRAHGFLWAASIWSLAYDKNTANLDLGIPLRFSPDFNVPTIRASVQETYDQIISDLKNSIRLLPNTSLHVFRASKPAALALLARTYLFMREYDSCFKYADMCLQIKNELINYNSLNKNSTVPFNQFNQEVIMDFRMAAPSIILVSRAKIDSLLYKSYATNDLRKYIYFRSNNDGSFRFKGSYSGSSVLWDGLAVDEIYLMRAECYARTGMISEAMNDLNHLMITRWENNGSWIPYSASSVAEALDKVLNERRKELIMRGLRWMDIKRLNQEGANITLQRKINGQIYKLIPNDLKFALPIPEDIIYLSGIKQNLR